MFQGTSSNSNAGYTPYTGLSAFNLLAVNPNKSKIEELTGKEYPFDVNYDVRDFGERRVRPLTFWIKSENLNLVEKITFNINTQPNLSKSGSIQFINRLGQFKWAATEEAIRQQTDFIASGFRPAMEGEQELYSFMQRFIKYKPSAKDAQFLTDCESNNITPEAIFNGDYTGINKFVEHCISKGYKIGMVLAVKERKETDDNGNEIIKNRQTIITKPESFFTLYDNEVGDYQYDRLLSEYNKNVAAGYTLSNDYFTIKPQKYVKSDCINLMPDNPKSNVGDDLPF